jgi:hypothetical protein
VPLATARSTLGQYPLFGSTLMVFIPVAWLAALPRSCDSVDYGHRHAGP